jgi:hypothetical protein
MQQAHSYTTDHEMLSPYILAPYLKQSIMIQLNQILLTGKEEEVCELATD